MLRATVLAVAATAVAAETPTLYGQASPVIGFSGIHGLFNAEPTATLSDPIAAEDVAQNFKFRKNVAPKVVLVLAVDDLKPQNALSKLGQFPEVVGTADSTSLPYTYAAGASADTVVAELLGLATSDSKPTLYVSEGITLGSDSEVAQNFDVQMASTEEAWAVVKDGSTEGSVFVYTTDSEPGAVLETMTELVGDNYVAFIVPTEYETLQIADATSDRRRLQTAGLNGVRMTPNIMLGLLTSVMLTFFLYIGFSSMMDIRENDRHWKNDIVPLGAKVEM